MNGSKTILRVREDLCRRCGLCADNCPTGAIVIRRNYAEIDQGQTQCCFCVDICPQGAIAMLATVSKDDLQASIISLKQRTIDIIERIESLKLRYR